MSIRTKWLGTVASLAVVASMAGAGYATVNAAGAKHVTHKTHSSASTRCKHNLAPKGAVKWSDWQFPTSLNAYQDNSEIRALNDQLIFDGLFNYNGTAHINLLMLTKYPSFANGGLQQGGKIVNIEIKKGLRWSNGAEITANDMKFGFEVDSDKATGPACFGSCDVISKFKVTGRYTASLTLKHPVGPLVYVLGFDIWPVKWSAASGSWNNNPAAAAKLLGQTTTYNFEDKTYPTNGPYVVSEFTNQNRIVYTPSKYYSNKTCGGALKNVYFVFYSDKPAMIAGAANHETDVTQDYTFFDLATLQKNTGAYKIHNDPGFQIEHFEFNADATYNGKPNPVSNVNVRLALALSLDKIGLIRSALSTNAAGAKSIVAYTPFIITKKLVQPFADKKITGQWDPIVKKYVTPGTSAAIKDAKKLLAKTPYASGFTIDMFTTAGNPVRATEVAIATNNWKKIGVTVAPNFIPAGTFFSDYKTGSQLNRGTFQVADFAFSGSPDPDQFKYNMVSKYIDREKTEHNTLFANYTGIHNAKIDSAFKLGFNTPDTKARSKAYITVQEQMNQNAYWIDLYYRNNIATNDSKIAGFVNNPTQNGVTWNSYDWRNKGA